MQQQDREQPSSGIHRCSSGVGQRSADRAPRLVSTWAHHVGGGVRRAVPDGLEQRPVLVGLHGPRSSGLRSTWETVPPVPVGGVPQTVEHLDEQRVVRGAVDRRVEPVVALQLSERRPGAQRLESVERGAGLGEVGVGAPLCGERRVRRLGDVHRATTTHRHRGQRETIRRKPLPSRRTT